MTYLTASLIPLIASLNISEIVAEPTPASPITASAPVVEIVAPVIIPEETVEAQKLTNISAPADPQPAPVEVAPAPQPEETPSTDTPIVSSPAEDLIEAADSIETEIIEKVIPEPPTLPASEILRLATDSLVNTVTAKGRFVQFDAYGDRAEGNFYLRRPGRLRLEYGPPTNMLIVSDGDTVAIEEPEVDAFTRAPLSQTPLKMFLSRDIDLTTDKNVVDVRTFADSHLIAFEDRSAAFDENPVEGQLILQFDRETFALEGWITLDGTGSETRVSLLDTETNVKIKPRLFVIVDPEEEDERDR